MAFISLHRSTIVRRSPAFANLECRFAAYLIDTTLFFFFQSLTLYFVLGYPFESEQYGGFLNTQFQTFTSDLSYLGKCLSSQFYFLILHWLYYAGMESSPKQATIGKMALGLKVTTLTGEPINFGKASVRYFGRYLSISLLFMGFAVAFFNKRHQTLHDLIACTTIRNKSFQRI